MKSFVPLAPALFGALTYGANVPPLSVGDPPQESVTGSSSTRIVSVIPSSSRYLSSTGISSFPTPSTSWPVVSGSSSDISTSSIPSSVPSASTPGETLPSNTPSDVPSASSTPSTTPTTTYPPVIVSVSTVDGATTNGHTSTVGPDHQTTLVPIIAPHCWFCPPGNNGWGLGGMTAPGVYPGGPPPPGWPSPLPPITIGPDGNPTYSSTQPDTSTKTSSSSSCTTETTSSCTISTSYGVDTAGSTTTTFSTTSCSTYSGCSVTGTTSTTATTSSATPGCWKYPAANATPAPSFARREVESYKEDDASNQPADEASLEKRGGKKGNRYELNSLGSCTLNQPITVPGKEYPGPGAIVSFMQSKGISFPGAYIVPLEQGVCAPPELKLLPDVNQLSSTTYYDGNNYVAMGTAIKGKVPYVNTEHVYELKTLPSFFANLVDSGKISCSDLNAALFPTGHNYGTELWKRLPSNDYPAFIALDDTVNRVKGEILQQGLASLQKGKSNLDAEIEALFNMALVFEMMRNGDINQWFQKTNALLYEYMRDTLDSQCSHKPNGGFAPAYSSWMEEHISTQASSASTLMTNRYAQATARPNINGQQKFMLNAMTRRYPTASWTFDNGDFLSWPANPGGLIKRTTCTRTTSSTTPGSTAHPTGTTGPSGGPHSGRPTQSTGLHPTTRPQPSSGPAPTATSAPTSSNPSGSTSSVASSPYTSSNPSTGSYSPGVPHSSAAPSPYSSSYPSPGPYSSSAPPPSSGAPTSTGLIPSSQPVPPSSSIKPNPSTIIPPQSSIRPPPPPPPPPSPSSVQSPSSFKTSPSPTYTQSTTPLPPPPPPPSFSTPMPPVTTQPPPPPPPPVSSVSPTSGLSSSIIPSPVYMRRRKIVG